MLVGVGAQIPFTAPFMFYRRKIFLCLWQYPKVPHDNSACCNHLVCMFIIYCLLNFLDKKCFNKIRAGNLMCLFQSLERKIFQLLWITKIMTSTKLHLMTWLLINHFRRKKPNNMFRLLYIHSHFYYTLFFHYLGVGWLTKVHFPPTKGAQGTTQHQVGKFSAALEPSAICSAAADLY